MRVWQLSDSLSLSDFDLANHRCCQIDNVIAYKSFIELEKILSHTRAVNINDNLKKETMIASATLLLNTYGT